MFLKFLLLSAILGLITGLVSQSALVGLTICGALLICGLPSLFKYLFIHHTVGWFSDRADLRQMQSDRKADYRAAMSDLRKSDTPSVVHDNRQIHFHGGGV
jgi:hypothetical protein